MNSGTHAQRIIALLSERSGLDDDEIAIALSIEPRQTVNQICRRLAAGGVLRRGRGPSGKIVNSIGGGRTPIMADSPRAPRFTPERKAAERRFNGPFIPTDFAKTLLIIPCSGAKRDCRNAGEVGPAITRSLPENLAAELHNARQRVKALVPFDERQLIPAWQRYNGSLYDIGRDALAGLMAAGMHVIIISGGYGAVLAQEPIGRYEARLKPSWWPNHLIERVLIAYAQRHAIASVRAFVSATGPYVTILYHVRWRDAGISDVLVLTPEAEPGGMRRSPATQGEALVALLAYFGEDIGTMVALVDRALALNPNFARGWLVSGTLRLWAGEPDIAIEHVQASLRLSPRVRIGTSFLVIGAAHFASRRFGEAVPKLLLAIQEDPGFPLPYRCLASCYAHMGRLDDAQAIVERLRAISPVVVPDASFLRNPEHRELLLSGLRLPTSEAT
jgi:hypothetical protein